MSGGLSGLSEDQLRDWLQEVRRIAALDESTALREVDTTFSQAYDINPAGRIVGFSSTASGTTHAFIWNRGVMTDLGTLGGISAANGINPAGQVVGVSQTQGASHAILWQKGVLGVLPTISGEQIHGEAFDINP